MIKALVNRVSHTALFHKSHVFIHTGYFTFVFIEGHGLYAALGGAMAVFTAVLAFAGQEG